MIPLRGEGAPSFSAVVTSLGFLSVSHFAALCIRVAFLTITELGLVATTAILGTGFYSFVMNKDKKTSQFLMRARVVAQGVTVVAFAIGTMYKATH
jgi:hypothetical protein